MISNHGIKIAVIKRNIQSIKIIKPRMQFVTVMTVNTVKAKKIQPLGSMTVKTITITITKAIIITAKTITKTIITAKITGNGNK